MKIKNLSNSNGNKKNTKSMEDLDAYDIEEDGFTEGELNLGKSIATFSFGTTAQLQQNKDSSVLQAASLKPDYIPAAEGQTYRSSQRGLTPPINGEGFTVMRCYQYRPSTIRKLNELKTKHPDVNVYLNTIIDEPISHYYSHVFEKGGGFTALKPAE